MIWADTNDEFAQVNENLNLLVKKNQSRLMIENEVMQNVLTNERANVNVKM